MSFYAGCVTLNIVDIKFLLWKKYMYKFDQIIALFYKNKFSLKRNPTNLYLFLQFFVY